MTPTPGPTPSPADPHGHTAQSGHAPPSGSVETTVIVPPLADVTVRLEWTAGPHRLLDPGRQFIGRLLATATTSPTPSPPGPTITVDGTGNAQPAVEGAGPAAGSSAGAEMTVRLRAGAAVLADPAGPLARLRAATLLVPAAAHHPGSAVEITLDDLELRDGTTEDSTAALRASRAPAPYDAELEETVAAVHEGPPGEIWLVLDRDQQLPAALTIAARLPAPLLITGRFAHAHWPVLANLAPLRRARLAEPPAPVLWRVAGPPTPTDLRTADPPPPGHPAGPHRPEPAEDPVPPGPYWGERAGEAVPPRPYWRERAGDPVPPGPWAGRAGLARTVADPDGLIAEGCTTVVLGVCAADHEVIGRGGAVVPMERMRVTMEKLRAAGITVLAELWLGAPGIGADRIRAAIATLTAPDAPVDRLVGLRPFDWPVHWTTPRWGNTPVEIDRTPGPDLARHHHFHAPGTLPPAEVQSLISEVGPALARTGTLIPARVAAAYLSEDPPTDDSAGIALAPDTVVIKGA
ncbi:hypothetical protein ACFP1K_12755, partial [Sphaerisporangium aureirubrum]